jgi:NAD(P)-dependent dehydrogenase (short-subunit alcohol dehydrogenase family)
MTHPENAPPPLPGSPTDLDEIRAWFDFSGRTAVMTGGTGVLGAEMARALAACNANVVLIARTTARAMAVIDSFGPAARGRHLAVAADVLDRPALESAAAEVTKSHGRIDFLINGAGGNDPRATTTAETKFFDLPFDGLKTVMNLNLLGTVLPTQVFGRAMADAKQGTILNITSVNAARPLTRIAAYSAAKAAISNFTQWLAVHLAQEYSPNLRANAIMPGFFLTEQNRFLLTERDGGRLTARGQKILDHTPMGRFGTSGDLVGAMLWLLSPAARFVTGIVVPVDGGFTAYSGV